MNSRLLATSYSYYKQKGAQGLSDPDFGLSGHVVARPYLQFFKVAVLRL